MTDRSLTADVSAAILSKKTNPILLYEGEFAGGTVRLFTGLGTISWNGHTWTGDAGMMKVSAITEVSDMSAVSFTVSLNGQISALVAVALDQVRRGKPGSIWIGFLSNPDPSTHVVTMIGSPYLCFKGRLDKSVIDPNPVEAVISVTYESRMIVGNKAKLRRYTSEDQKIFEPTDLGFNGVPGLQDAAFVWVRR